MVRNGNTHLATAWLPGLADDDDDEDDDDDDGDGDGDDDGGDDGDDDAQYNKTQRNTTTRSATQRNTTQHNTTCLGPKDVRRDGSLARSIARASHLHKTNSWSEREVVLYWYLSRKNLFAKTVEYLYVFTVFEIGCAPPPETFLKMAKS